MITRQPTIGLVSFSSLGDGLIYLMMSQNLQDNGLDVTCYGDVAYQLRSWVPHLKIKPYPKYDELDKELSAYDIVLMSPPQFIRDSLTPSILNEMRKKWILICQKVPVTWSFSGSEELKKKLGLHMYRKLEHFIESSGSIRYRGFVNESVVDIVLCYMKERWKLTKLKKTVALSPPALLKPRRFPHRIVISPDSAGPEEKNWSPELFFRVCHRLQKKGYEVVLVVSPQNFERWSKLNEGRYEMPLFNNLADLAAFVYESGGLIANDSGNGHLASFLGVPVLTIYKKRNQLFHWRPDWGAAKVVTPFLTLNLFKCRLWKPFVRPFFVVSGIERLLKESA